MRVYPSLQASREDSATYNHSPLNTGVPRPDEGYPVRSVELSQVSCLSSCEPSPPFTLSAVHFPPPHSPVLTLFWDLKLIHTEAWMTDKKINNFCTLKLSE